MSDNRKYYYLKLKENYFDDDSIVLLESMQDGVLYEHNAFTSHLMLDSDEVYQMTRSGLDAAQIAAAKGIHLNLVLVKLLELHHLGYDLRHYHAQHHAFIKKLNLPAHFQFDVAAG